MPSYRESIYVFSRGQTLIAFVAVFLLCTGTALAQGKESAVVIELGGAGDWGLNNGSSSFGPTVAVDYTAIPNWLVVQAGVTPLLSRGQTEWDTDLIFEKPFDLSPTFQVEPGIGPEWAHTISGGRVTDTIAAEAAIDFMIWPTQDRRFGWFVEPSYSYSLSKDHQQSLGVSAGLLIAIP